MVTLTEKEATVVDELYAYFIEQEHTPIRSELYQWVIRRMHKYMMLDSPPAKEQYRIIEAIVNSFPLEETKDGNAG